MSSLLTAAGHYARMTTYRKAGKVRMVCETCGSEDVMHDAWAVWDVEEQNWVLGSTFDYMHCDDCEGETHILEVSINY
jgi:hypothetical protein